MSQLPLLIQTSLGSFAGSHSNLSGPPTQVWPAAASCTFFFAFFSKIQKLIAKNSMSSVTTSLQNSPHSQQSISCWFCLPLGAQGHWCLKGKATQALGFGIAWASCPGMVPNSDLKVAKQELAGWLVLDGWSWVVEEPPGSSQHSAPVFVAVGSTVWQG